MGVCWCKDKAPDEEAPYAASAGSGTGSLAGEVRPRVPEVVQTYIVDRLVLEMLTLIASFVDNDEESPVSLVKLHVIADKEDGWIQVVTSMVNVIPLEDPFGPSAITILFDDCPLPSKESVIRVTQLFELSAQRANTGDLNIRVERNICVVLGCIAEKLAGPNSVAVLTDNTLDYLLTFLITRREACIVLFALIALEKFAHTTENKLTIKSRLEREPVNPLLTLEELADSDDYMWRQVGFCAKWTLDNLFIVDGRKLSYEVVDMSGINVILNSHDVSEYLKISCNGLEARCDSYSFESVRCTFQVDEGCWYYESVVITPGVMQIGWATKNSHFLNHSVVHLKISCNGLEARCDSYSFESVRCTFQVDEGCWYYESVVITPGVMQIGWATKNSHFLNHISSNGLEARCDSYSFERVRCTFQVDEGCWYYKSVDITPGVMQIGWATKNSHFLNHEGYGIGDDLYSLSYDGCRKLVWYKARASAVSEVRAWKPGDVLGCLIDLTAGEVIFSLNGQRLQPCREIFETTRYGFFAAASFMAFQQCRFNFGSEPFKYPPVDRPFSTFNEHGHLTDDEKKVVPRRVYLEQLRCSSVKEDSCTLCFDDTACCVLEPCGHRGFCSVCTSQLKECPMCRAPILNVRREDT